MTDAIFQPTQPPVPVEPVAPARKKRGRGPARPKAEAAPKKPRKQRRAKAERHPADPAAPLMLSIDALSILGRASATLVSVASLLRNEPEKERKYILQELNRLFA